MADGESGAVRGQVELDEMSTAAGEMWWLFTGPAVRGPGSTIWCILYQPQRPPAENIRMFPINRHGHPGRTRVWAGAGSQDEARSTAQRLATSICNPADLRSRS